MVKYQLDFPKLSVINSYIKDGVIFYITKKNHNGKVSPFYVAYEYDTKVKITFFKKKEDLINFLENNINEIKKRLGEING